MIEAPAWCAELLLDVWEHTHDWPTAEASLRLLRALSDAGGRQGADAAGLTIGGRDAELLRLRRALFGPSLDCVATCPSCAARVETAIGIDELEPGMPALPALAGEIDVAHGPYVVRCRCLTAGDAPGLQALGEPARIADAILTACILDASCDGLPVAPQALPEGVLSTVAQAIVDADPFAQIRVELTCPACSAQWSELLDPPDYVVREFDAWCLGTMRDVHLLARAYGWSEHECLAVPPSRRTVYLELVGA